MKTIRYLRAYKGLVALIFALLVLQAAADLALPHYTSNIVDVGISASGIENAVPESLSQESLDAIIAEIGDAEVQVKVENSYVMGNDGLLVLSEGLDKADVEILDEVMATPEASLYAQEHNLDAASMEAESASAVTESRAIKYVQEIYESDGVDVASIQKSYLTKIGLIMLGITLVGTALAILIGFNSARLAARVARDLRNKLFANVMKFSKQNMNKFSSASLITRGTNDIMQIQQVMVMLVRIVLYAPILGIGASVMIIRTNSGLGWISVVAVLALIVLVGTLLGVTIPKFKVMQKLIDRLNLVSREIITGVPVIRTFGNQDYESGRFEGASRKLMDTQLFTNRVMVTMMPAMMLLMNLISMAVVWFGAEGVQNSTVQVGQIIALIAYITMVVMAFLMISAIAMFLPRAEVAAGRINEVLDEEATIEEPENPQYEELPTSEWKGHISFDHVSFRFPEAEEDVVCDFTLDVAPGKTTAIIGPTGSGKSTVAALLERQWDATKGTISIDGVDIRDLSTRKLHSLIGYVPQKVVLFSGDFASNIKYGNLDMPDSVMQEAARIAQAAEFIEAKPEGYQTEVTQGGQSVSGGQRQRLSIARALAIKAPILLFDDSFSALDYKTDRVLRTEIEKSIGDSTVIIIAQRIATIMEADLICVLDEGKIIAQGTHEELLKTCDLYREVAENQLGSQLNFDGEVK